jgi:nitrogen fixation-related uncharacterized protein
MITYIFNSLKRDASIYLNGFAVGMLLWSSKEIGISKIPMYLLAMVTFLWYGKNKTT